MSNNLKTPENKILVLQWYAKREAPLVLSHGSARYQGYGPPSLSQGTGPPQVASKEGLAPQPVPVILLF